MNLKKQINNLYIEYLNSKYDNTKLKNMDIDIKKYKINNKYKGVQKFRNDKYRVQMTINNKIYSLGVFDNMEIAAKKYAIISEKINKQTIKGGKIKFQNEENDKCKDDSDCDNVFQDLKEDENVKCNLNSGVCDRYIEVEKYIEPEEEEFQEQKEKICGKNEILSSTGKTCRKNVKKCPKGKRRSKSLKTCQSKFKKCKNGSRRSKSLKRCIKK